MGILRKWRGYYSRQRVRGNYSASTGYLKGYPYEGSFEPNVVAQWVCNEASGPLIDTVSGISISKQGSPTYQVAAVGGGSYTTLGPGVGNDGTNYQGFEIDPTSAVVISGSFVIEIWAALNAAANDSQMPFATGGIGYGTSGVSCYAMRATAGNETRLEWRSDDGVQLTPQWTLPQDPRDGAMHKWRYYGALGSNVNLVFDGVDCGAVSHAALAGKTVTSTLLTVMFGGYSFFGTVYGIRITVGNSTNNAGGPLGG